MEACRWGSSDGGLQVGLMRWMPAAGAHHMEACRWGSSHGGLQVGLITWRPAGGAEPQDACRWGYNRSFLMQRKTAELCAVLPPLAGLHHLTFSSYMLVSMVTLCGSAVTFKGNIHPGRIAYIFKFGLT